LLGKIKYRLEDDELDKNYWKLYRLDIDGVSSIATEKKAQGFTAQLYFSGSAVSYYFSTNRQQEK
jgi:uncharacterized protein YhaN